MYITNMGGGEIQFVQYAIRRKVKSFIVIESEDPMMPKFQIFPQKDLKTLSCDVYLVETGERVENLQ